jgi:hypothetical protein
MGCPLLLENEPRNVEKMLCGLGKSAQFDDLAKRAVSVRLHSPLDSKFWTAPSDPFKKVDHRKAKSDIVRSTPDRLCL